MSKEEDVYNYRLKEKWEEGMREASAYDDHYHKDERSISGNDHNFCSYSYKVTVGAVIMDKDDLDSVYSNASNSEKKYKKHESNRNRQKTEKKAKVYRSRSSTSQNV